MTCHILSTDVFSLLHAIERTKHMNLNTPINVSELQALFEQGCPPSHKRIVWVKFSGEVHVEDFPMEARSPHCLSETPKFWIILVYSLCDENAGKDLNHMVWLRDLLIQCWVSDRCGYID
jgi:hypothetical protein